MNKLGERIRALRLQKGLNQGELAKGICTPSMISQIETDRANPSPHILFAVAERLGVAPGLLLDNLELNLESKSKFMLAKALQESGEYQMGLVLLEELRHDDSVILPVLDFLYRLGSCYIQTAQLTEAETVLNELMEAAVLKGDLQMVVLTLLAQGSVATKRKAYPLAIHQTERALGEYKKLPEAIPDLQVKVVTQLAELYELVGLTERAEQYYAELLPIYEQISNPEYAAQMYLSLAKSHQARGQYHTSLAYATRARSLFQQLGNQQAISEIEIHLMLLNCTQSNWRGTVEQLKVIAVDLEEQTDKRGRAGRIFAALSDVCIRFADMERAEMFAEDALQLLPERHEQAGVAYRTLAYLRLHQKNWDEARKYLHKATTVFTERGMGNELEETTHSVTEMFSSLGCYKESYEYLHTYHTYVVQQLNERGIRL